MSARYQSQYTHPRSQRSGSRTSDREANITTTNSNTHHLIPNPTPPPDDHHLKPAFEPCAATASYFLYAQRNLILSLHHDTLSVDRRFDRHRDDVLVIAADNVSERGAGRLVVSYDASQTAIVWDLFTGDEVARFASFETIRVAAWMRDGCIAFGNSQGAVILFETSTSEHTNTRTIFDPITALAPCSDCRTFAIGYQNGSIIIATLSPAFTMLHTLTTSRAPCPVSGLAWHGSSSRQKSDMLATQTSDGVLRVWSVSKAPHTDPPRTIRVIQSTEMGSARLSWFAWSKNGRLVNYADGDARVWDVRTKQITGLRVPVINDVVAVANYGPNGTLFTVSQNHGVQQYDLVPEQGPVMVKQAFHVPHNAPPTPPASTELIKQQSRNAPASRTTANPNPGLRIPIQIDTDASASEDEGPVLSPLQRIAREMDDLEDERRDQLAPLSPVSSRASMSSASSYGGRRRRNRAPSRSSRGSGGSGGTVFSNGSSEHTGIDTMSIHSGTSLDSSVSRRKPVVPRQQLRTPEPVKQGSHIDLFPYLKTQLGEVKFRPPRYDESDVTPDILRIEMLSVVFGWEGDIEDLIRDEQSRHAQNSAGSVLLSKWLGVPVPDQLLYTLSSDTMSSSDWMLLAACTAMGSQGKQIGETFVRNLLSRDEIHPAVTILMGFGDLNEAVEVYVSRKYYLEAILLTCLCFPHDWQRQSHLVRKWGEVAVTHGQPELAVRCFSCTSIECSEAWFSPKSQDLVYQAQQQILAPEQTRSPVSPPSASGSNRMTTKNASLKLITSFGDKGAPKPQLAGIGATPIQDTAITPGPGTYRTGSGNSFRDVSETRTATPGGYRRNRMPSATRSIDLNENPMPGSGLPSRRATPAVSEYTDELDTAIETAHPIHRIGSANGLDAYRSRSRGESRDRNKHNLHINTGSVVTAETSVTSPGTSVVSASVGSVVSRGRHRRTNSSIAKMKLGALEIPMNEEEAISPAMPTGGSLTSYKGRSIDRYISSLEEANHHATQRTEGSRSRNADRDTRSRSRPRPREGSRARSDAPYGVGKVSPTSPKSMTAEDVKIHSRKRDQDRQAEGSPEPPKSARPRASSKMSSTSRMRPESPERSGVRSGSKVQSRNNSRANTRREPPELVELEVQNKVGRRHSPTSPVAMESQRAKSRTRSSSRKPSEAPMSARARSSSRRPKDPYAEDSQPPSPELDEDRNARALSRKEQAAYELEQRRLSLARRPSAPPIPQPGGEYGSRSNMSPRSATEEMFSSRPFLNYDGGRSHTADPEAGRFQQPKSSSSMAIGLPATPKAMRLPGERDVPAVPAIPDLTTLAPVSYQPKSSTEGPLLPSSVFVKPPILRSASAPPEKFARSSSAPPEKYFGTDSPRDSPTRDHRLRRESNASRSQQQQQLSSRRGSQSSQYQQPHQQSHLQRSQQQSQDYSHSFLDTSDDVIIVPEQREDPPVLAELAHLAGPPPPPPPPPMYAQQPPPLPQPTYLHSSSRNQDPSGVINIAIDSRNTSPSNQALAAAQETGMAPLPLTMANLSRRNAETVSSSATQPNTTQQSSRWARVADKMRSTSRSRGAGKTPSAHGAADSSPYETVLPNAAFNRTRSPQSESGSYAGHGQSQSYGSGHGQSHGHGYSYGQHRNATPAYGTPAYGTPAYGTPAPYETAVDSSPERRGERSASAGGQQQGQLQQGGVMRNPKDIRAAAREIQAGGSEWI